MPAGACRKVLHGVRLPVRSDVGPVDPLAEPDGRRVKIAAVAVAQNGNDSLYVDRQRLVAAEQHLPRERVFRDGQAFLAASRQYGALY